MDGWINCIKINLKLFLYIVRNVHLRTFPFEFHFDPYLLSDGIFFILCFEKNNMKNINRIKYNFVNILRYIYKGHKLSNVKYY